MADEFMRTLKAKRSEFSKVQSFWDQHIVDATPTLTLIGAEEYNYQGEEERTASVEEIRAFLRN